MTSGWGACWADRNVECLKLIVLCVASQLMGVYEKESIPKGPRDAF
jgi:hypothetical protein